MGRFSGFADADAKFFRALKKNQNRDWFKEHKEEYEEGWNLPMKALLADVKGAIDDAFNCDLDEPRMFRIFRDVRFSKDKTPYKTHIAGCLPTKAGSTKISETPVAMYAHFGVPENAIWAGSYMMDADQLARFRAAVAEDKRGKELVKILASLVKAGFHDDEISETVLKRVPKGFDPDHPRAHLLRRKGCGAKFPELSKGILASPKLVKWIADHAKKAAPLVEWLVYATA